jgi:hypothetical protein
MLYGAGIFMSNYPKKKPVLQANVPAPWRSMEHIIGRQDELK